MKQCLAYSETKPVHELPQQEIEMKQCLAYSETKPVHELPQVPTKEDRSTNDEQGDENNIYEKIPGES